MAVTICEEPEDKEVYSHNVGSEEYDFGVELDMMGGLEGGLKTELLSQCIPNVGALMTSIVTSMLTISKLDKSTTMTM